jgi:hypothetical protein
MIVINMINISQLTGNQSKSSQISPDMLEICENHPPFSTSHPFFSKAPHRCPVFQKGVLRQRGSSTNSQGVAREVHEEQDVDIAGSSPLNRCWDGRDLKCCSKKMAGH